MLTHGTQDEMANMASRTTLLDKFEEDRKALRKYLKGLQCFQEEVNEMIPLQALTVFLMVALNEGRSLKEYQALSGMKQSTISRHLLDLGERHRTHTTGYGLIFRRQDPMELRKNQYTLTDKGKQLVKKVVAILRDD